MFYLQGQIKDLLHCQNCGEVYQNPRVLPCGETICEVCLKKIQSTIDQDHLQYTCPLCNSRHTYPDDEYFPLNMSLVSLLKEKPMEFLHDELEERLKLSLDKNSKLMWKLEKNFSNNGVDRVKEYCDEVKSVIKEVKNQKIESINKMHESLVNKVDLFQTECIKRLASSFIDFQVHKDELLMEVKQFEAQWRECFQQHNLDKLQVKEAIEIGMKLHHKLENKLKELDRVILNNRTCEFHKNCHNLYEDILGD